MEFISSRVCWQLTATGLLPSLSPGSLKSREVWEETYSHMDVVKPREDWLSTAVVDAVWWWFRGEITHFTLNLSFAHQMRPVGGFCYKWGQGGKDCDGCEDCFFPLLFQSWLAPCQCRRCYRKKTWSRTGGQWPQSQVKDCMHYIFGCSLLFWYMACISLMTYVFLTYVIPNVFILPLH